MGGVRHLGRILLTTPLTRLADLLNAPAPPPWDERVGIYREALEEAGRIGRLPLRASLQVLLAKDLLDDRSLSRSDSLEEAISGLSEAARIFRDHGLAIPAAEAWTLMAAAWLERIQGAPGANAEAAIRCCRRAFQAQNRRSRPSSWAEVADCLAGALRARARRPRTPDQEKSLDLYRRALLLRENHPTGWVQTAVNCANAWNERISGDRAGNVEEAIRLLRRAEQLLSGRKSASPEAVRVQLHLAVMYREHLRGDLTAHREQAIDILSRLLSGPALPPLDRARAQDHLGVLFVEWDRGRRAENLARAITLYKQALEVHTFERFPRRWLETTLNLARAFAERRQGDGLEDLRQAIFLNRQILDRIPPEQAPDDRAVALSNLATALSDLPGEDRPESLREAVALYRQVLEVRRRDTDPRGWALTQMNLGNAFARLDLAGEPGAFDAALAAYRQALEVHQSAVFPGEHRRTQGNLADLFFSRNLWPEALEAFRAALAAGDAVYQGGATPEARRAALRAGMDHAIRAAWCLARLGRAGEAAGLLERSRTRNLNEALGQTADLLPAVPSGLRDRLLAARERIVSLEAQSHRLEPAEHEEFLRLTAELSHRRAALAEILDEIRQAAPGALPEETSAADLIALAAKIDAPLIYLLTTVHGSLALLVPPGGEAESLFLDLFRETHLREILHGESRETSYLHLVTEGEARALQEALDRLMPLLEDGLLAPLARQLAERGVSRAWLIPCGSLGLLPLTAPTREEPAFHLSPSARALEAAWLELRRRQEEPPRLLAVGNPFSGRPLAFAGFEAREIADLFPADRRQILLGDDAALDRVRPGLRGTTHLHLSCHAQFLPSEPLRSSLDLCGEPLHLRDLFDPGLDLASLRLAVLSACQTGVTDQELPEEALGFPAAFLQAGVPATLSTLWPVDDGPTAFLLIRFYQNHLAGRMEPAAALREAQRWLQTATVRELRLVEHCERLLDAGTPSKTAWLWRRRYRDRPEAVPFAHPYFWAGFVIHGV